MAHPINTACREQIQQAVIEAYRKENEASQRPDYEPQVWDDDELGVSDYDEFIAELKESASRRAAAKADRGGKEPRREAADQPVNAGRRRESKHSAEVVETRSGSVVAAHEAPRSAGPVGDGFASGIL